MKEILVPDDEIIVSKTDTNSHITYGNKLFIEISGYKEKELLGQPHNIIRHPDMPKTVYKLLWDTIKSDKEFFGLVKNRCKNNDYYWVFANITASFDHTGKVIGYFSVRRKPSRKQLEIISPIYNDILALEKKQQSNKPDFEETSRLLLNKLAEFGVDYNDALLKLYKQN